MTNASPNFSLVNNSKHVDWLY